MATTQAPDLDSLTKWEDAFQHSIPTVRGFERQLRASLAGNREKLRMLVGESYRDLLNTAERIIELDKSIQQVESHLGTTSEYCNWRLMQRKADNARLLQNALSKRDNEKYRFAIQLQVLQNCPLAVSRLLQENDTCLLASKVFIMSRLLLKSLSQQGSVPIVENLRRKMSALRSVLLRYINRAFVGSDITNTQLLGNMAAYSLITSSSCADVLVHFQSELLDHIGAILNSSEPDSLALLNAFRTYSRMLTDSSEVFPLRLSDMLLSLKSRTLFADSALRNLSELNLTSHMSWIPEHIRNFTPWVRHGDLSASKVRSETTTKSGRAIKILLKSAELTLSGIADIDGLVALRNEVLSLWKLNQPKLSAIESDQWAPTMDSLRKQFHEKAVQILEKHTSELSGIATTVGDTIEIEPDLETRYIWDHTTVSSDISQDGGKSLKRALKDILHGKGTAVKRFDTLYSSWLGGVAHRHSAVKFIAAKKEWDPDNMEDFAEDLDHEGTKSGDLNKIDSDALVQEHLKMLKLAFESFDRAIRDTIEKIQKMTSEDSLSSKSTVQRSAYLLRILSKVRYDPPRSNGGIIIMLDWIGAWSIPQLHRLLAEGVIGKPLAAFGKAVRRIRWTSELPFSALWEGTPPLPVHPSPNVFKFLDRLTQSISSTGIDIWRRKAIEALKCILIERLRHDLIPALEESMSMKSEEVDKKETPAEDDASSTEREAADKDSIVSINNERLLQTFFDMAYLDVVLRYTAPAEKTNSSDESPTHIAKIKLSEEFYQIMKSNDRDIEDAQRRKISNSAEEYWKKTSLLFGLLDS